MKRFEVTIGEDFEIEAFDLECIEDVAGLSDIVTSHRRSRTQERMAYILLGGIGFALAGAASIGIYDGTFNEVSSVWSASAFPLGYILKAYFEAAIPP